MDDYALKQQLVGELKETLQIKRLNLELMEAFEIAVLYMLSESDKNGQVLPNAQRLQHLIKRVKTLYEQLYPTTKLKQPSKTPSDSTKPNSFKKINIMSRYFL